MDDEVWANLVRILPTAVIIDAPAWVSIDFVYTLYMICNELTHCYYYIYYKYTNIQGQRALVKHGFSELH
jgi:hypothetical protein